jgi:pimeloyl-ACP methyl ester carboxylesterase
LALFLYRIVVDYISKYKWTTPTILISPYKSICKVVLDSSLTRPIDKFRSLSKLSSVKCPIKIFHGEADEVINISHGKEIYKNLGNKTFDPVWLAGIGHNNILEAINNDDIIEVLNYSK